MQKIGFIGAGKVGVSLGKYLFAAPKGPESFKLEGYFSRSSGSSAFAANFTSSKQFPGVQELVDACDIIFITTPDDGISHVWGQISKQNIQNKIICHCSGSLSSNVFFNLSTTGAFGCSIHPMFAISSKEKSYLQLSEAFFTLEGDNEAVATLSTILKEKNNDFKILSQDDKTKYHVAAVFMSNLEIALTQISIELLSEYGFSQEEALKALKVLATSNMEKIFEVGIENSLTGPVERCDVGTVKKHIAALSSSNCDEMTKVYKLLSSKLIDVAKAKHRDKSYSEMENLLKEEDARK